MPAPTPIEHAEINKAWLDELAALANAKVIPKNYNYFFKVSGDADICGEFNFPELSGAAIGAWRSEVDRIWCSLWDKDPSPMLYPSDGAYYDLTHGLETTDFTLTDLDRLQAVLSNWDAGLQLTCVSVGPHLWTHCTNRLVGATYKKARAFAAAKFIFSKMDAPAFNLRPGFILGTIDAPYFKAGDGVHHAAGNPATVQFDFSFPAAFLYGQVYFIFQYTGADPTPDVPNVYDIDFSGWGFGGSGVGTMIDATHFALYLGNIPIANYIDVPFPFSGTLNFSASMDDTDWVWSGFGLVGVIQTGASVPSTDAAITTRGVIHPRNTSWRAAVHLNNDPHLHPYASGIYDILDLDSLVAKIKAGGTLPPTADPASQYIYDTIGEPLETWIDEYPGGAHDTDVEPALIDALNALIDGQNLYLTGSWGSVTLRQITQFLLDARPQGGLFLQILNRLLLEDAYPTEIRRLPENDTAPEEEIVELAPDEVIGDPDYPSPGEHYFFQEHGASGRGFSPGYWVTLTADESEEAHGKVNGVWIAKAWPQPFYHTFLDGDLPQYAGAWAGAHIEASTQRRLEEVNASGGVIGSVSPSVEKQASYWPVMRFDEFGQETYSGAARNGNGLANMQLVAPYWTNDSHHNLSAQGDPAIADNDSLTYNQFIADPGGDAMLQKARYEFSVRNRNVTIYVGTGTIDPGDPGTYLFTRANGGVAFPDDFIQESLTPSDYYGGYLNFLVKNSSGASQQLHIRTSIFYSQTGENPPMAEPLFFPRYSRTSDDRYAMGMEGADPKYGASLASDVSYCFTSPLPIFGAGHRYPVPDRGYTVCGLVIRRKPVLNAAGISVDAPATVADSVRIGVMGGTGVLSGAISGCFPGEFIQLAEYVMGFGESVKIVEVFWPVIEGCPLAWKSDLGNDYIISAAVDFQPGVNVSFRQRTAAGSLQQGGFGGQPDLLAHFAVARNKNNASSGPTGYPYMCLPPLSARSANQLYRLLALQPDL